MPILTKGFYPCFVACFRLLACLLAGVPSSSIPYFFFIQAIEAPDNYVVKPQREGTCCVCRHTN